MADAPTTLEEALAGTDIPQMPKEKKATPKRAPATAPRGSALADVGWENKVRDGLTGQFTLVSMAVGARCDFCGPHIAYSSPKVIEAWIEVAKKSPRVKRALITISVGGVMTDAIVTSAALAVPVLMHHGLIPLNHEVVWNMQQIAYPAEIVEATRQKRQREENPEGDIMNQPESAPIVNGQEAVA